MSAARQPPEQLDCIVIGGGLAGLACAHTLAVAGKRVHLLEAGEQLGGRARTAMHAGVPVDRGFQVLFAAYPETRRFLEEIGLRRRDLRRFDRGAIVHDGSGWARFGLTPRAMIAVPGFSAADAARFALLAAEVAPRAPESLLAEDGPEPTTEAYLRARGFSEGAIEGFFRPFFGVVLLDRSLGADPGYFRFLVAMLTRGPAVLPADGLGMVADWAAGAIRRAGGAIETAARVRGLEPDAAGRRIASVALADGRAMSARYVVLAVDAPAAGPLLSRVDRATAARLPSQAASVLTAAYLLERPLYRGRAIVLNTAPADRRGPRVDLVCQTSNVTRPGSEHGPHVLLATSVTTDGGGDPERLPDAVGDLVARWSPRYPWGMARLLEVIEHRFAQFRPLAGVRHDLPGPRTAMDNLILAGDLARHPSIEGAVGSGRSAARIVAALAN